MPTTLHTKQNIKQVSHKGKQYPVIEGVVSVPDDAVDTLCEAHGFTAEEPPSDLKHGIAMPVDKPVNKGGRPKRLVAEDDGE